MHLTKSKKRSLIALAVAAVVTVSLVSAVGCGDSNEGDDGEKYTITTPTVWTDSDKAEVSFTGQHPFTKSTMGSQSLGYNNSGIFPWENWGANNFATNEDGVCNGTGLISTMILEIGDETDAGYAYTFTLDLAVKGNGKQMLGEGNIDYVWTGVATKVSSGYTLAAPTYGYIAVTGTIKNGAPTSLKCPDAPYKIESTDTVSSENMVEHMDPAEICHMFYGATVVVSGKAITGFENVVYYPDWAA